MKRTTAAMSFLALLLFLQSGAVCAVLEGRVEGEGVYFTPHPARSGEGMRISVGFNVTGGPVSLSAEVQQTVPRYTGPPPPTIVLGSFNPGRHTAVVYHYTVPASPPERFCVDIKMTGGLWRDVCLKRGRSPDGYYMDVESAGRWVSTPMPAGPASTEKPDLRIVGNLYVDEVVRVENIGRAPTAHIRMEKECFVGGRWASTTEFENPATLSPGQSVEFRVGRMAGARGPCPSGSTKVRLYVDSRNLLPEMEENNNILEASMLADLKIVDFRIVQQPLRIVGSGLNQSILVDFGLDFDISNAGPADAGPFTWDVSVFRDGRWGSFVGERVPGLAAGAHFKVRARDVAGQVRAGEQVRLRIDGLNEVPEVREDDNTRDSVVRR